MINNEFISGLFAGLGSSLICNPFDVIRTNSQLSNKINYNISFLSRGLLSSFITIPSFWSIYFSSYKYLKEKNNGNFSFVNGYIASNISSTITTPLWFIRQKNQVNDKFNLIKFYKKHGIKTFYNGLSTTYLINSSFIVQIPLYEFLKNNDNINNCSNINYTSKIFIISSISKTISACIFYPFDTIRTYKRNSNLSFKNIVITLNKSPLNYYNGLNIYLIRSVPYHATTFSIFEFFNKLNKKNKK